MNPHSDSVNGGGACHHCGAQNRRSYNALIVIDAKCLLFVTCHPVDERRMKMILRLTLVTLLGVTLAQQSPAYKLAPPANVSRVSDLGPWVYPCMGDMERRSLWYSSWMDGASTSFADMVCAAWDRNPELDRHYHLCGSLHRRMAALVSPSAWVVNEQRKLDQPFR